MYSDTLYHHGIKGQKWGVRRFQNPDGTLTALGKRRIAEIRTGNTSSVQTGKKVKEPIGHHKLTTNRFVELSKTVALTTMDVAAVVLIPGYGPTKFIIDTARDINTSTSDFKKKDGPVEDLSSMKKCTPETPEEALKKVNPGKPRAGSGREVNCASCAMAMDMRRRGYDVKARRQNGGLTTSEMASFYKDAKVGTFDISSKASPQEAYDQIYDQLSKEGNGNSRGMFCMGWKTGGGHAIFYESRNGVLDFYDGQDKHSGVRIDSYFVNAKPDIFDYVRTDNVEPKDSIGECVVSVPDKKKKKE